MKWKTCRLLAEIALPVLIGSGFLLAGCSSPSAGTGASPGKTTTQKSGAASQTGATLWAQNCGHCHNIRSPDSYSDAQWDVAMLHMRIRANLTAEEHKQILAFLKSAH